MTENIDNILILEDQPVMRAFLKKAAHGAFPDARLTEVATIAEATAAIESETYTLALLDISLPDGSGIDLLVPLKLASPSCKMVMCTIFDDDEHIFTALRAGAQGYLLKEHPLEELIEQLQQILSGRPPLSPLVATRILDFFHQPEAPAEKLPEPCHLTDREQEVLILVSKGLTRNEVAQMLGIGVYTVADYIKSVYRKLDVSSRAEATLEALRMGLIEP